MDTLGALALATEPPTDKLMKRPPVGRRYLISTFLLSCLLSEMVWNVSSYLALSRGTILMFYMNGTIWITFLRSTWYIPIL